MKVLVLCCLLSVAFAKSSSKQELYNPLFQSIIDEVNKKETTWKAGHNFDENVNHDYLKHLCGTFLDDPIREEIPGEYLSSPLTLILFQQIKLLILFVPVCTYISIQEKVCQIW